MARGIGFGFNLLIITLMANSTRQQASHVQLIKDLMQRKADELGEAAIFTRPIKSNDALEVKVSVKYRQLVRMDTFDQILTSNVWLYMIWTNEFMTWDPADYGNITTIEWPARSGIWLPDITIYNVIEAEMAITDSSYGVIIHNDGKTELVVPYILKTPCLGDVTRFPFDQHSCNITVGPWMHPVTEIDMNAQSQDSYPFFEFFDKNPMWNMSLDDVITQNFSDSAFGSLTYRMVHYKLKLTRNASFFFSSLILPACLLNILTFVVFLLPPDFPDSVSIGVSIFLSYVVLIIVLVEATPSGGQSLPLMGQFYCINMCMAVVCIGCTAVTYNVHCLSTPVSITSANKLKSVARFLFVRAPKTERGVTSGFWVLMARVLNRAFFLIYVTVTVGAYFLIFYL